MKVEEYYKGWKIFWDGEEKKVSINGKDFLVKTIQIIKEEDS